MAKARLQLANRNSFLTLELRILWFYERERTFSQFYHSSLWKLSRNKLSLFSQSTQNYTSMCIKYYYEWMSESEKKLKRRYQWYLLKLVIFIRLCSERPSPQVNDYWSEVSEKFQGEKSFFFLQQSFLHKHISNLTISFFVFSPFYQVSSIVREMYVCEYVQWFNFFLEMKVITIEKLEEEQTSQFFAKKGIVMHLYTRKIRTGSV